MTSDTQLRAPATPPSTPGVWLRNTHSQPFIYTKLIFKLVFLLYYTFRLPFYTLCWWFLEFIFRSFLFQQSIFNYFQEMLSIPLFFTACCFGFWGCNIFSSLTEDLIKNFFKRLSLVSKRCTSPQGRSVLFSDVFRAQLVCQVWWLWLSVYIYEWGWINFV